MMKKILFISVLLVFIVFAIVSLFLFYLQSSINEILIDQQITVQDIKSPVFRDFLKKIGGTKWRLIISRAHPSRPSYAVFLCGTTDASFNIKDFDSILSKIKSYNTYDIQRLQTLGLVKHDAQFEKFLYTETMEVIYIYSFSNEHDNIIIAYPSYTKDGIVKALDHVDVSSLK